MPKTKIYTIDDRRWYLARDVYNRSRAFFPRVTRMRQMIATHELDPEDYQLYDSRNGQWHEAPSSMRRAKLFLSYEWVNSNVPGFAKGVKMPVRTNYGGRPKLSESDSEPDDSPVRPPPIKRVKKREILPPDGPSVRLTDLERLKDLEQENHLIKLRYELQIEREKTMRLEAQIKQLMMSQDLREHEMVARFQQLEMKLLNLLTGGSSSNPESEDAAPSAAAD